MELVMMSKKKILDAFNGTLLSNLDEGGHTFNFFKGGHLKESLRNPGLQSMMNKMCLTFSYSVSNFELVLVQLVMVKVVGRPLTIYFV